MSYDGMSIRAATRHVLERGARPSGSVGTRRLLSETVLTGWLAVAVLGSSVLAQDSHPENVLFIVADDLGVDVLQSYGEGSTFPPTPTIDMLRDGGVLFRNAWANPVCSPTRATIQTGRYGLRTGVGGIVGLNGTNGLQFSETIIPEMLDLNPLLGYHHAAIGK